MFWRNFKVDSSGTTTETQIDLPARHLTREENSRIRKLRNNSAYIALRELLDLSRYINIIHPGRLVDRLSRALRQSYFPVERPFVPEGKLQLILTKAAVQRELEHVLLKRPNFRNKSTKKESIHRLTSKICPTLDTNLTIDADKVQYRKIFAILLFLDKTINIESFIKNKVSDGDLPLVGCKKSRKLARKNDQGTPFLVLEDWNESTINNFELLQWRVLAPIFRYLDPPKKLDESSILPIIKHEYVAGGGYSVVYKAKIHPDHYYPSSSKDCMAFFAIKELIRHKHHDVPYENKILCGLYKEKHRHDHLISLVATYFHNEIHYLIFPWAETDLSGYWQHINPKPLRDDEMAKWLVQQCCGLACGLHKLHHWETTIESNLVNDTTKVKDESDIILLSGRHGDIKPKNVLWFADGRYGILKIADFGATRFYHSTPPNSSPVPTTPDYRAPEYNTEMTMNNSWDIWALGCLYLEFITWFSHGWRGVHEFAQKRLSRDSGYYNWETTTFYTENDGKLVLKNCVIQQMYDLRHSQKAFNKFLEYIRDSMLVIQMNGEEARRNTARQVMENMSGIQGSFSCG